MGIACYFEIILFFGVQKELGCLLLGFFVCFFLGGGGLWGG